MWALWLQGFNKHEAYTADRLNLLFLLLKTGIDGSQTDGDQVGKNTWVGTGAGRAVHAVKTTEKTQLANRCIEFHNQISIQIQQ